MIAEFKKVRNDLFWKITLPSGEILRWTGYDDLNWWKNIATTDKFVRRQDINGNLWVLDPGTDEVTQK